MFANRIIYIPFNEQKCHVTNFYTVEEKQKYHITFFCEKHRIEVTYYITFFQTLLRTCGLCHAKIATAM